MKKRLISIIMILAMVFIAVPIVHAEKGDVTTISTLEELEQFRDSVNGGKDYAGETVILTADIDMSEKYGEDINGETV